MSLAAVLLLSAGLARADFVESPASVPPVAGAAEKLPSPVDRYLMLVAAEKYREAALKTASAKLAALGALAEKKADAAAYPAADLKVVRSWLNAGPETPGFSQVLAKAKEAVDANAASKVDHTLYPDSKEFCAKADDGRPPAYAWTQGQMIRLCKPWLVSSEICRRAVAIHEAFHTVGLVDVDAKLKFPKRTTAVALTDAAYMAGLVSELHSAHQDSCP